MTRTVSSEPRARILIVDDEPFNVDYLEQELESHGYVTDSATNGFETLERVVTTRPDLVLLDVMMPGMDGISALRILKQDPETRLIPVVLMTALNALEDRVRGIEAGADDFLSKPVDERELLARIRTALGQKRAIDETVDELRATSAHLERYGRQERNLAILAIRWRSADASVPHAALAFVGRTDRAEAEQRIQGLGGVPTERTGESLVAVFDGVDPAARSLAAVEAALAVLETQGVGGGDAQAPRVTVNAAVSVGLVRVGSTRSTVAGDAPWRFGAEGDPVDRATQIASAVVDAGILVTEDAAAALGDRFRLEAAGDGTFRVLGRRAGPEAQHLDRSISTILVTDIVGSTRTVEQIGDRAWAGLVSAHERAVREEIARFGGREVDTTGDGFIVSFANPTPAIHCASAVGARVAQLGMLVRAGVHTGEVELVDGRPRGIALHIASRIAGRAEAGEILVSATSRELARGARLVFTDRGDHILKGVPDPRRLFAAVEEPARSTDVTALTLSSQTASTPYPAGLTAREVDVLRLVALGLSDAEAAERLFVSVRTVNAHLRSIYRKAGVRSRAAAGRFAEENHLL